MVTLENKKNIKKYPYIIHQILKLNIIAMA